MRKKEKDLVTVEMLKDATRTIITYMKDLNDAITKLDNEIKVIKRRLDQLQTSRDIQTPLGTPPDITSHTVGMNRKEKRHLPVPPKVTYSQPNDLRSELKSVLNGGVRLKSVEQGKEEELQELRSAVHEEFKMKKTRKTNEEISDLKTQLTRDLEESLSNILKKKKR